MSGDDRFFGIKEVKQTMGLGRAGGGSRAIILNRVVGEELREGVI